MYKFFNLLFLVVLFANVSQAVSIQGKVSDKNSGELLVGCTIYIDELKKGTSSGFDGTYNLNNVAPGTYTLVCSYISYKTVSQKIRVANEQVLRVNYQLEPQNTDIDEVLVTGHQNQSTDISARSSERTSSQVMNVVSAKTIEISPDLTVANVVQRVSGVTLERNNSGDGQYALLRGMDKRFNYTMVNGMKIPSPDNKNRFVPLDIFPSELLDRLEVSKSLTANMEGDGIGGAINMIMKDAPARRQITANLATGYNTLFFDHDYQSFGTSTINRQSPNERYGLSYPVQMKDFSTQNMHLNSGNASPNLSGGFSYGDRFGANRVGVMLAGSYQNNVRGNLSNLYQTSTNNDGEQAITHRIFSTRQTRSGAHAKFDFHLSPHNRLMWYNAYLDFRNEQVRAANSSTTSETRLRWNRQRIVSSTMKGFHTIGSNKFNLDWALSYGKARNETPDEIQVNELITNNLTTVDQNEGATRRWEHNSDRDIAGNLNLTYQLKFRSGTKLDLSTGGMYRDKARSSFFNEYTFKPYDESKTNTRELIRGVDYTNFDEIKFTVASYGNLSDPLNYDATEKIGAGYLMETLETRTFKFIAGVRAEYTNQGYTLAFTTEGAKNEGDQEYVDWLPSFSLKYPATQKTNIRLSYARAINRPSFFEIVPYNIINEDYKERGNPDLDHTTADNIDLRYEYFPDSRDQFMVGLFYKNIQKPIEFGMMNGYGQDTYYMPMNFGNADNYGLEIDLIKYFSWCGVKANYTYTNSNITTSKMLVIDNPDEDAETNIITEYVNQTRPLNGQAEHVANLSLLLKDNRHGWNGQLAFSYTGDRLAIVSRYYNQDIWQAGYLSMDASVEKRFKSGLILFAKVSNLLNAPMIRYTKPNENDTSLTYLERYHDGAVERKETYGRNLLVGVRIKLE